jgi:intergrase/recombinase
MLLTDFHDWLARQNKTPRTIRETVNYARRFASVLDTGDAALIVNTLKPVSQPNALKALANLAKFQGRYELFNQIKRNYNLKWEKADSLKHFENLLSPDINLDTMLERIRQMMSKLPLSMGKIVHWGVLVGLRSSEIVASVRYINDKEAFPKYYDAAAMTLNHWKMPGMLRTTKKAFLSFVTPDMLAIVQNMDEIPSHNSISKACQRKGIACDMRYCRKVFATYLHEQAGIPVDIIDALQGRTPTSIFARHYFRPSNDYKTQVLAALEKLQRQL